jgi:hypothetical protein
VVWIKIDVIRRKDMKQERIEIERTEPMDHDLENNEKETDKG